MHQNDRGIDHQAVKKCVGLPRLFCIQILAKFDLQSYASVSTVLEQNKSDSFIVNTNV